MPDSLHNLFLKSDLAGSSLLRAIYRDPQITAYNRLELGH
jgi:hypothetical protein